MKKVIIILVIAVSIAQSENTNISQCKKAMMNAQEYRKMGMESYKEGKHNYTIFFDKSIKNYELAVDYCDFNTELVALAVDSLNKVKSIKALIGGS